MLAANQILIDKLIANILDEIDQRNQGDVHEFLIEWFLKKYGIKDIAELLLKDFLISLRKYFISPHSPGALLAASRFQVAPSRKRNPPANSRSPLLYTGRGEPCS